MSSVSTSHPEEAAGLFYALGAYAIWGFVPLYWRLLGGIGAFEITVHRILWCAVFTACVTSFRGRMPHFIAIFSSPRVIAALAVSSVLITVNWTVFIWCVTSHQLVEASLGYYLTPLVSIALGVSLLNEQISARRIVALLLASVAVLIKTLQLGHFPWIAPALALSFGLYGYVRKLTPVDAFDGLTTETALLFPLVAVLVVVWAITGVGVFPSRRLETDALLIGAGPLTAVPLVLFAAGARRLRMTTLGFLQYASPTITLLVATGLLGERFTHTDAFAFACVWTALILATLEAHWLRAGRKLRSM